MKISLKYGERIKMILCFDLSTKYIRDISSRNVELQMESNAKTRQNAKKNMHRMNMVHNCRASARQVPNSLLWTLERQTSIITSKKSSQINILISSSATYSNSQLSFQI